ncbi:conserved hypothetical protein [Vibrio owensii]|uniref:Lipoprotein n=1 Tax=Vibrio owensii TaxID=696485 RepID=A0AAU9Q848_9VIBR|nr:conserved hypothetical protein [Vibrio owensii]
MIKLTLTIVSTGLFISGCATNSKIDYNQKLLFELCNTEVDNYFVSDNKRIYITCSDGSQFTSSNIGTLETMRNINIDYCEGEGLGQFSENHRYYSFKCKSGPPLSISK